jgi:Ran GTPase-activating protein (RanGAP) involved in mRNA processing and transport
MQKANEFSLSRNTMAQQDAGSNGLTLELTSARSGSKDEIGSVRKIELNDGGIRLIVTLPRLIDGEQANLTAALLFEQIDRLPYGSQVERVKLTGLQFTSEGVVGIKGFLSVHAKTIKHVSLKDMMAGEYNHEDAEAFASLAKVFQTSKLETLNLSDNTINASMWKNWSTHTSLRQLILDYVQMDDDSLVELQANFTFADSLEELYVVLTNNLGPRGLNAANGILKSCRKMSSLRWAVKDAPPDAKLPWFGLAEMAQELSNSRGGANLRHLVMDGGTITEEEEGNKGLAGALKHFSQLKTIKLRSVGLKDSGAKRMTGSLLHAKPPLESLDLSRNHIQAPGATALSKLSGVDNIVKNLALFALDRNLIEAGGARTILEAFGSRASHKLDIKLDGNPFHYGKVAFNLACRKGQAETERDELVNDVEKMRSDLKDTHAMLGDNTTGKSSMLYDIKMLQEEINKLREEKAALVQAFSVIGILNQVEDQTRLFDRVSHLERTVFGSANDEPTQSKRPNMTRRTSIDTVSSAPPASRVLGRASSQQEVHSNMICDSPAARSQTAVNGAIFRKISPSSAASGPGTSTRQSMRDLGSPLGHHNSNNVLVRGISERWGASPVTKSKPPAQSQSQGLSNLYTTGGKKGRGEPDESSKTNNSRSSFGSDLVQQHSSRDLEYNPAAWNGSSYSGNER